jgi:hypothetical protein
LFFNHIYIVILAPIDSRNGIFGGLIVLTERHLHLIGRNPHRVFARRMFFNPGMRQQLRRSFTLFKI